MTDNILFTLPEEVRPEHTELHIVPMRDDGSIHLERIHFRAGVGDEQPPHDYYLAIYGDRYNGLPGLYYDMPVPNPSEVWVRVTWRNDVHNRSHRFVLQLVFEEALGGHYGYGDNSHSFAPGIALSLDGGPDYMAEITNIASVAPTSGSAIGSGQAVKPIIDFHITRTGTQSVNGPGGTWATEVYENEVLRWSGTISNSADPGFNLGRAGIGALVIPTQYASYVGTNVVSLDNIMAGTSQGASDLMSIEDFSDGTIGILTADSNEPTDPSIASFVVQDANLE